MRATLPYPDEVGNDDYTRLHQIIVNYAEVVDILVALNPSEESLQLAQVKYDNVFFCVQSYLSDATEKKNMSINFHAHLHLAAVLMMRGSIRNIWLFYQERFVHRFFIHSLENLMLRFNNRQRK